MHLRRKVQMPVDQALNVLPREVAELFLAVDWDNVIAQQRRVLLLRLWPQGRHVAFQVKLLDHLVDGDPGERFDAPVNLRVFLRRLLDALLRRADSQVVADKSHHFDALFVDGLPDPDPARTFGAAAPFWAWSFLSVFFLSHLIRKNHGWGIGHKVGLDRFTGGPHLKKGDGLAALLDADVGEQLREGWRAVSGGVVEPEEAVVLRAGEVVFGKQALQFEQK